MEDNMLFRRFVILVFGLFLLTGVVSAQNDPIGTIDTVSLFVENLGEGQWLVSAHVWNDENIAAIDIPIKYSAGMTKLIVDSVSFIGTRIENFAMKNYAVDTTNQIMHFGGFAYLSPDMPPMAPGSGEVARIYISVSGDEKAKAFAVDTTTYGTNSTLTLVDENAKSIIPALKIGVITAIESITPAPEIETLIAEPKSEEAKAKTDSGE